LKTASASFPRNGPGYVKFLPLITFVLSKTPVALHYT
jgi:hypothetical protein